ncbi:sortase [Candidatus Saccharibacteria bacterium]|nr:sortase [Candidatus Saccharibacteria bacterium]
MELKRRLNFNVVFVVVYALAFLSYIIFGLQPAEAVQDEYDATLSIPSISLDTPVVELQLNNHELETPNSIVGSFSNHQNKTLLIAHSTTAFSNLNAIQLNDAVYYSNNMYKVIKVNTLEKQNINMSEILSESNDDTLVLMTCAGELLEGGDATHRLIVEAVKSI